MRQSLTTMRRRENPNGRCPAITVRKRAGCEACAADGIARGGAYDSARPMRPDMAHEAFGGCGLRLLPAALPKVRQQRAAGRSGPMAMRPPCIGTDPAWRLAANDAAAFPAEQDAIDTIRVDSGRPVIHCTQTLEIPFKSGTFRFESAYFHCSMHKNYANFPDSVALTLLTRNPDCRSAGEWVTRRGTV